MSDLAAIFIFGLLFIIWQQPILWLVVKCIIAEKILTADQRHFLKKDPEPLKDMAPDDEKKSSI